MKKVFLFALIGLSPSLSYSETSDEQECQEHYDVFDLYASGGVRHNEISLRIYSKLKEGVLIEQLGVYDFYNMRGREVSLGKPVKADFGFFDEIPDQRMYHLRIDAKGSIEFGPSSQAPTIQTSIQELREEREKEAAAGCLISVSGASYRILPQGGTDPAYLCFPADSSGKIKNEAPGILVPAPGWIPGITKIDGSCARGH